jgi:hypothetical protein
MKNGPVNHKKRDNVDRGPICCYDTEAGMAGAVIEQTPICVCSLGGAMRLIIPFQPSTAPPLRGVAGIEDLVDFT